MAHYLVKAKAKNLPELYERLQSGEIQSIQSYGSEMNQALLRAKQTSDGWAVWEENCYCSPPLKQEREVLDQYFSQLTTETVSKNEGWQSIEHLPSLWETE